MKPFLFAHKVKVDAFCGLYQYSLIVNGIAYDIRSKLLQVDANTAVQLVSHGSTSLVAQGSLTQSY